MWGLLIIVAVIAFGAGCSCGYTGGRKVGSSTPTNQNAADQMNQSDNDRNNEPSAGRDAGSDDGDGGAGCFVPGTMVDTESGAEPIEGIKVGSTIYSAEDALQSAKLKTVVGISQMSCKEVWAITLQTGQIVCTKFEKFLTPRGLVPAPELKPGDTVKTRKGHFIPVLKVEQQARSGVVFNLITGRRRGFYVEPQTEQPPIAHEELHDDDGGVYAMK